MQGYKTIINSFDFFIGFSADTDLWYLKFLKKGFRHCFLFCGDEYQTFIIDPVCNKIEVSIVPCGVNYVIKLLTLQNVLSVKVVKKYTPKFHLRLGIFTCVEVVKRILGISNIFIITPFRLYKYLQKE